MKIISFPFWENIVNNKEWVEGELAMKMKRIAAWILALSLCISNSGLVYAAENTGMEEKSRTQEVQQEEKNFVKNIFSCSSSFTSVFE